jgi:anthranilate synthase component 2
MMHVLLLDNQDSFTYNIAETLRKIGNIRFCIVRSDEIDPEDAAKYDKIIFSPGPGLPSEQPAMMEILGHYEKSKSILGICLGHQAIALRYGARLENLPFIEHGSSADLIITAPGDPVFRGISQGTPVGLYHSWAVDESSLPSCLNVTARSANGVVMGIRHKMYDVCGLQFHPESYITKDGLAMLRNWLLD